MKKLVAMLLVVVCVVGLTACGGGSGSSVKGEQKDAGKISVFVPEKYNIAVGSITGVDDTDDTQCYITPDEPNMYDYYWICIQADESAAKTNVEMSKEINKADDVTVKAGDTEWKGCHYVYKAASGDVDCGGVYAEVDGTWYLVNFCGHKPDSAELTAVLGSIKAAK